MYEIARYQLKIVSYTILRVKLRFKTPVFSAVKYQYDEVQVTIYECKLKAKVKLC